MDEFFMMPYRVINNSIYFIKGDGEDEKVFKLCNFVARIVEDVTCTNGEEEDRFLIIEGINEQGNPLRKIKVPVKNFNQLDWVQELWNMNCVIETGFGNRDKLRQAIQSTAKFADEKTIYGTTGWWKTKNGWQFCMPGGNNTEVKLTEKTKGYSFETDLNIEETVQLMKTIPYSITKKEIMFPILSYSFESILGTFMAMAGKESKTVIMLYGKTGSMKTTLALLINSLFGKFNEDNIPLNFRDTPKSILNHCFTLRDCSVVIDDYHPGSNREKSAQDATTQALIRGICNREARGTLDKNGKQRSAKRPQCNAIMTAEFLPNVGESGTTRFISLELRPGDINTNDLSKFQDEAEKGTLSHFTFLATEMLKEKYLNKEGGINDLLDLIKTSFIKNRKFYKFKSDEINFNIRPRLCDDLANLKIGFEFYTETLLYYKAITVNEQVKMLNEADEIFLKLAINQQSITETEQPTEIFINKLRGLMTLRKVKLVSKETKTYDLPNNIIGYYDKNNYYFEPDATFTSVIKSCSDTCEHFPLDKKSLMRALKNEGISICNKGENTKIVRVYGENKRLICIPKERFNEKLSAQEEMLLDGNLPFGPEGGE